MSTHDEALQRLLKSENGVKKVATCMINPIRLALKDLYGKELTKEQEVIIEASVQEACIGPVSYQDVVRLQDKLIKNFNQ